mgnify:CR=1 FL=1
MSIKEEKIKTREIEVEKDRKKKEEIDREKKTIKNT